MEHTFFVFVFEGQSFSSFPSFLFPPSLPSFFFFPFSLSHNLKKQLGKVALEHYYSKHGPSVMIINRIRWGGWGIY